MALPIFVPVSGASLDFRKKPVKMPGMGNYRIENILFRSGEKQDYYSGSAHDGSTQVGVLEAQIYPEVGNFVGLYVLSTNPEYRRIGIARRLVEDLVAWSEELQVTGIRGLLIPKEITDDTPEHVKAYLRSLHFTVNLNEFYMRLT